VVSVLGTLTNTTSAGSGSNPTVGIQSSIFAVNFLSNIEITVHRIREDLQRKIPRDQYNSHRCLTGFSSLFQRKEEKKLRVTNEPKNREYSFKKKLIESFGLRL
jgi:hypothetical protein